MIQAQKQFRHPHQPPGRRAGRHIGRRKDHRGLLPAQRQLRELRHSPGRADQLIRPHRIMRALRPTGRSAFLSVSVWKETDPLCRATHGPTQQPFRAALPPSESGNAACRAVRISGAPSSSDFFRVVFSRPLPAGFPFPPLQGEQLPQPVGMVFPHGMPRGHQVGTCEALPALAYRLF